MKLMQVNDDTIHVAELLIHKFGTEALLEAKRLAKLRDDENASGPKRDWGKVLQEVERLLS